MIFAGRNFTTPSPRAFSSSMGRWARCCRRITPPLADFGGPGLENCNENLCLTRPEWIADVHRAYLEAGADIIETNSFQGSPIVLAEFKLEDKTHELNVAAAKLARQAADEFSTTGQAALRRRLARSHDEIDHAPRRRHLRRSCRTATTRRRAGLIEGGADLLLVETGFDTRNVKAAIFAVQRLERELGSRIPADDFRHDRALGRDARRASPWTLFTHRLRTPICSRSASTARPVRI